MKVIESSKKVTGQFQTDQHCDQDDQNSTILCKRIKKIAEESSFITHLKDDNDRSENNPCLKTTTGTDRTIRKEIKAEDDNKGKQLTYRGFQYFGVSNFDLHNGLCAIYWGAFPR